MHERQLPGTLTNKFECPFRAIPQFRKVLYLRLATVDAFDIIRRRWLCTVVNAV